MKKITPLLFVFFFAAALSALTAQEKPKIVFEKLEHNFGTFKESAGVQTYSFKFTNAGKVPLLLNNVVASCGCTTPKWTKEPVIPGGKGEIEVSYDPTSRIGSFAKTITVQSNAENQGVVLTISGTVLERERTLAEMYPEKMGDLMLKTSHIYFPKVLYGQPVTENVELINSTSKPIKIGLKTLPDHITAKIAPETVAANGKSILTLVYDPNAAKAFGYVSNRIYFTLNGSSINDYSYSIAVSANIEEDFSKLTPEQVANAPTANFPEVAFDFGDIKQESVTDHTFMLENKGKSNLIIRNVRSSCGCTAVAPAKEIVAPGETVPIKVSFDARGKRGRESKTVTVITNDPKNPVATLRISCNILTPEG